MAVCPKVPYRTLTVRPSPKPLHAVPIRTLTHTHPGYLGMKNITGIILKDQVFSRSYKNDAPGHVSYLGVNPHHFGAISVQPTYMWKKPLCRFCTVFVPQGYSAPIFQIVAIEEIVLKPLEIMVHATLVAVPSQCRMTVGWHSSMICYPIDQRG